MRKAGRVIAMVLALSVAISAVTPLAHAQQPAAQPPIMQDQLKTDQRVDTVVISDEIRAGVTNVFRVPGKTISCLIGTGFFLATLAVTFGMSPEGANYFLDEGCGGKWVLSAADMRRDPPPSHAFDWETHRFDWEPR